MTSTVTLVSLSTAFLSAIRSFLSCPCLVSRMCVCQTSSGNVVSGEFQCSVSHRSLTMNLDFRKFLLLSAFLGVQANIATANTGSFPSFHHAILRPRVAEDAIRDEDISEGRTTPSSLSIDESENHSEVSSRETSRVVSPLDNEEEGKDSETGDRSTDTDHANGPDLEGGVASGAEFVSSNEVRERQYWRPERLRLLLEVFDTYTRGLRVLQLLSNEVLAALRKWDRELRTREERMGEVETRRRLEQDFGSWQSQLSAREAELLAREMEFEEVTTKRLREHLEQIANWEVRATEAIRSCCSSRYATVSSRRGVSFPSFAASYNRRLMSIASARHGRQCQVVGGPSRNRPGSSTVRCLLGWVRR